MIERVAGPSTEDRPGLNVGEPDRTAAGLGSIESASGSLTGRGVADRGRDAHNGVPTRGSPPDARLFSIAI